MVDNQRKRVTEQTLHQQEDVDAKKTTDFHLDFLDLRLAFIMMGILLALQPSRLIYKALV